MLTFWLRTMLSLNYNNNYSSSQIWHSIGPTLRLYRSVLCCTTLNWKKLYLIFILECLLFSAYGIFQGFLHYDSDWLWRQFTSLDTTGLHWTTLYSTEVIYILLYCTTLHYLPCTELHLNALWNTALHFMSLKKL